MKSEGHTGLALLLVAPLVLGFSFLVSDAILYTFIILMVIFVNIPDVDYRLSRSFIGDITGIKHRGFTHTIYFAIICGMLTASFTVPSHGILTVIIMFMSGFLGVTLHCAGDVVTPTGIKFIPLIQESSYSLDWFNYNNVIANFGFFILGFVSIGIVFSHSDQPSAETLLYFGSLYLVFAPLTVICSIKSKITYNTSTFSRFFSPVWWVKKLF